MVTSITSGAIQHLIGPRCYRDYNRDLKTCRKGEGTLKKRLTLASPGVRYDAFLFFEINDLPVEPCRECVLMSSSCVMCFPFDKPLWLVPFIRGTEDKMWSGF